MATSITPTQELASFIANLQYDAIPPAIRERVKDIILDAIASAIAGTHGDEVKQIRTLATALGASQEASVFGGGKLSLAGATLLNGYLVTAVTVCDVCARRARVLRHCRSCGAPFVMALANSISMKPTGRSTLVLSATYATSTTAFPSRTFSTTAPRNSEGE